MIHSRIPEGATCSWGNKLYVLGIESSCDETAAAVLFFEDGMETGTPPRVLSNVVASSLGMWPGRFIREKDLPGHIPSEDEKKSAESGDSGLGQPRSRAPSLPKKDEKDIQLERAVDHLKKTLQAGKGGSTGA